MGFSLVYHYLRRVETPIEMAKASGWRAGGGGRTGAVFGGLPVPGGRGRAKKGINGRFWGKWAVFRGFPSLPTACTGLPTALTRLQTGFPSRETAFAGLPMAFAGWPAGGASGRARLAGPLTKSAC